MDNLAFQLPSGGYFATDQTGAGFYKPLRLGKQRLTMVETIPHMALYVETDTTARVTVATNTPVLTQCSVKHGALS